MTLITILEAKNCSGGKIEISEEKLYQIWCSFGLFWKKIFKSNSTFNVLTGNFVLLWKKIYKSKLNIIYLQFLMKFVKNSNSLSIIN
jgi:hypothetical protein